MSTFRLYSDRQRDADKAGQADVYQYNMAPSKLRVQLVHIATAALGKAKRYYGQSWQKNPLAITIRNVLLEEKGIKNLGGSNEPLPDFLYYLEHSNFIDFLDTVEVFCYIISSKSTQSFRSNWGASLDGDEAISRINHRFKDAALGYQYQDTLIRVDSQYVHSQVVIPALILLNEAGFEGVQMEFLSAHEHYRNGHYEEAITNAAKAFESMMKAICVKKGWEYKKGARASDLVKVLRAHSLWPEYLDGSFDQLLATLSSGLPKVRNEDAAHGQGPVPRNIQDYVAGYAIHLAAAKILFLSSASKA